MKKKESKVSIKNIKEDVAKDSNSSKMSKDVHIAKVSKIQRSTLDTKKDVNLRVGNISPHLPGPEADSPDHTQRDTNESDNNISSCSTLDIVNKVENLTLQQLEMQVRELSQCLKKADEQRTELQRQLNECNAEKELCFRRMDVLSAAHECRITEMHCVIAELSKKLRTRQESTIPEELEQEGTEISYQEGSIYNSELNLTNPDAECQTEPLEETRSMGDDYGNEEDQHNLCVGEINESKRNESFSKGQVEALQEEVLHLKAQIALLQAEIASSLQVRQDGVIEEKQTVEYYNEDVEANDSNCSLKQFHFAQRSKPDQLNDLDMPRQTDFMTSCAPIVSPQKQAPVAKMAERVKLRCASKIEDSTNLLKNELKNTDIVEHFATDLKQNNNILDNFVDSSQLDAELQRLQRLAEHFKIENTVLTLTLEESKEHSEHLYLLCGKYESNAIALQMAVNCSDRAIEAYDVMLALLESKLALMKEATRTAEDNRRAVESVARHLLDRLESEKDICENSLGPWQNTFSIPEKTCAPWTFDDDTRLRHHVSKLKGRRATVQNTIVNLESPFSDFYEKSRLALEGNKETPNKDKSAHLDLEMAVLMQELLNLREENIELKAKADQAEKDRQHANEQAGVLQETLKLLQMQVVDSSLLFHRQQSQNNTENRVSYSEAEHAALTEQQLVEALTRESELKGRIQSLVASVSASQKLSDEKYAQLHSNVRELQKSNLCLGQLLEQSKRKYQSRIRKLEQKIMEMALELGRQTDSSDGQMQLKCIMSTMSMKSPTLHHENVPETTL